MSDAVLDILRLGLLLGLFIFFLWVLRTGMAQFRSFENPGAVPVKKRVTKSATSIRILEPAELAGVTIEIGDELTIGRAASCVLTLDDTYASQLHASIVRDEGKYFVQDTGSTNGTFVNRERITSRMILRPADRIQIGSTIMELT